MINDQRSRSFSFKSFKKTRFPSFSLPPTSSIFAPAHKKPSVLIQYNNISQLDFNLLSSQQQQLNNRKNQRFFRLQSHLKRASGELRSDKEVINNKSFHRSLFERAEQQKVKELSELRNTNSFSQKDNKQKCMYKFFANMWRNVNKQPNCRKKECQERNIEQNGRSAKSKSIAIMRRMNKKKEQTIIKARQRLQRQFRNKKQIPIHHTQFHFNQSKKLKSITQQSSISQQLRKKQFTQKIHRAVQQILELRASFNNYGEECLHESDEYPERAKHSNQNMIIKGDNFSQFQKIRQVQRLPKKQDKFSIRKASKINKILEKSKMGDCQIGPWRRRNSSDFQLLF